MTAAVSTVANAQPADLSNADELVRNVAPELLGLQEDAQPVQISSQTDQRARSTARGVSVSVVSPFDSRSTKIGLLGAEGSAVRSGEISVFDTGSAAAKAYVQPTPAGVRLLTAIGSRSASSSYSYTFNTQPGTVAMDIGGGVLSLEQPDGTSAGLVAPA